MNIQEIISTLSHIVPFWSTSIVQYAGIGHEYSMIITLILQNMVEFSNEYITEPVIYCIFTIIIMSIFAAKNSWIDMNTFIRKQNILTIIGNEKDNIITYSDKLCAVSKCLVEDYNYSSILIGKTSTHILMLDCTKDFKINKNLYLTIKRTETEVHYVFKSYTLNISNFIDNAWKTYGNKLSVNSVILFGKETSDTYAYPQQLMELVFTIIDKYCWKNIIIKNTIVANNDENVACDTNINKTFSLLQDSDLTCVHDDVTISVSRTGDIVKYELRSQRTNLNTFLHDCHIYYRSYANKSRYLHKCILQGNEQFRNGRSAFMYPKTIFALCHYLINTKQHKQYKKIQNQIIGSNQYRDVINIPTKHSQQLLLDTDCLKFDDIILSINRIEYKDNLPTTVTYSLESDSVDLHDYVNKLTKKYETYLEQNNEGKLYHFIFMGYESDEPKFITELIYDQGPIMNETFDNIVTEHNDMFISDLERLHDADHYRKFGLKRKLSYIFHGKPGTGKTSTAIAMAIKDRRHIISIRVNPGMKSNEFTTIMALREINNISFARFNRMILIEEIDYALANLGINNKESIKSDQIIILKESGDDSMMNTLRRDDDKLSYDTLLTEFDGIRSYDRDIFIVTTNHIENLNPALYRERRLTPIKFRNKKNDEILVHVKKYFPEFNYSCENMEASSAKIITLCEKYYETNVEMEVIFKEMSETFIG
jgi:hypothetical protein